MCAYLRTEPLPSHTRDWHSYPARQRKCQAKLDIAKFVSRHWYPNEIDIRRKSLLPRGLHIIPSFNRNNCGSTACYASHQCRISNNIGGTASPIGWNVRCLPTNCVEPQQRIVYRAISLLRGGKSNRRSKLLMWRGVGFRKSSTLVEGRSYDTPPSSKWNVIPCKMYMVRWKFVYFMDRRAWSEMYTRRTRDLENVT